MILKNSVLLLCGSILAILVQFASLPIITRFYDEQYIGLYGYVGNYATIFTVISAFGLIQYINNVQSNRTAYSIAYSISVVSLLCSFFFWFLCHSLDVRFADFKPNSLELLLISVIFFLTAITEVLCALNSRSKNFTAINITRNGQAITTNLLQLMCSLSPFGGIALIFSRLFGLLALLPRAPKFIFNSVRYFYRNIAHAQLYISRNLREVCSSYFNAVVSIVNKSIPYFAFYFFDSSIKIVAYYSIADRVLNIAMTVYRTSLSVVLNRMLVDHAKSKSALFGIVFKSSLYIILLGGVCMLLSSAFSVQVFSFVFGNGWGASGVIFNNYLPVYILLIAISPILHVNLLLGQNFVFSLFYAIELIAKIFFVFLCVKLNLDINQFLLYFSYFSVLILIFYIVLGLRIVYLKGNRND